MKEQLTDNSHQQRILESIRRIVKQWVPDDEPAGRIDDNTDLLTEIGLDSIGVLHLVLDVEKEFAIKIEDHELRAELFSRAGNFMDLIKKKLYETDRPS
jgi:acyl carrier protein